MNLRTYDNNSLVLYANDNLNNFIHLFIHNGTQIIYLFNYKDEIIQINVTHEKINKGESVQIAIIRTENTTTLHVNDKNTTIDKAPVLLSNYTNKPWINPELGELGWGAVFLSLCIQNITVKIRIVIKFATRITSFVPSNLLLLFVFIFPHH